jgi:hypothetical protein
MENMKNDDRKLKLAGMRFMGRTVVSTLLDL